jgi:hypothetical protein
MANIVTPENAQTLAIVAGFSAIFGALISGIANYLANFFLNKQRFEHDKSINDLRIKIENETLALKIESEKQLKLSEQAWRDYETRRDLYIELAKAIGCLFENGDLTKRPSFFENSRSIRLVGSDETVRALNALTDAIKRREQPEITSALYGQLFNAARRDLRTFDLTPKSGTDLDSTAFPIES